MPAKGWMIVDPDGLLVPGIVGDTEKDVIVEAEGSLESAACWQDLLDLGYRTAFIREVAGTSLEAYGISHSVRKWSELLGVPYSTLRGRLRLGNKVEELGKVEGDFKIDVEGLIDGQEHHRPSPVYGTFSKAAEKYVKVLEKVADGCFTFSGTVSLVREWAKKGHGAGSKTIASRKFPPEDR
jgi:hypothetical protein